MNSQEREKRFVICVRNDDYPVSLEVRKVYEAVPDPGSEAHHLLRVIDDSGEDYLYPEDYFMQIKLSAVKKALFTHRRWGKTNRRENGSSANLE